jgi:hypothetical protein
MLGTKKKWEKIPPPLKNLKEKNSKHFECMLGLPIGCMKFLFPKLLVTIFGLGYYPHYKLGVLINKICCLYVKANELHILDIL